MLLATTSAAAGANLFPREDAEFMAINHRGGDAVQQANQQEPSTHAVGPLVVAP